MAANSDLIRLQQLLRLVAKADHQLQAVRDRCVPHGVEIDIEWLQGTLDGNIGTKPR